MGGAVSSGKDNSELVDNLCYEDYIQTPCVERVFRMIDRADYMLFRDDEDRLEAYEDHAWRRGTLHLSAPCIYTRALEALKLERGVSFLNIGSGTGYFSTMAGMLIGPFGVNHGIELYPENVEYAHEKLQEFKENSRWYNPTEFCEPVFIVGNGLLLSPGNILYDRIYCGAACPPEHAQLMKNMLNVGGILVMPHDNQLEAIKRVDQTEWATDVILPSVSFAPLILPSAESVKDLQALETSVEPHPLKSLCRLAILSYLTREYYDEIHKLPLPTHLKDYVSHYREWGPPEPLMKTLCPIDHTKEREKAEGEGENNTKRKRRRDESARGNNHQPSFAHTLSLGGRRVLMCNFNGIMFQIPVDSDDSENDSSGGHGSDNEEDSGDDPAIFEKDNEDTVYQSTDEDGLHSDENFDQSDLTGDFNQSDDYSQFEDTVESMEQSDSELPQPTA